MDDPFRRQDGRSWPAPPAASAARSRAPSPPTAPPCWPATGWSAEIEAGERIKALAVDVTDAASIEAVIASAAGARVDVLVYVAGGIRGQRPKPLEDVSVEDFHQGIPSMPTSPAALPVCAGGRARHENTRRKKGRIVTISSRAAVATSLTGIQAYASAKHGQLGLVHQLAHELGPFGITVNTVAPGFMGTSPDYEPQWKG